jgi:endonuclease YncB( thermonuclease family)
LPINRPRRIFRSGFPRLDARALVVPLGVVLIAAAGVSLATLSHHETVPVPSAEELNAPPAQVAVVDGGTLRLRDRVVRLRGVEPPSRDTVCEARGGAGEDCGGAATNALAALVRDTPVACRITGADDLGRPFAVCRAGGDELNRAVIAAGWGRADRGEPALKQAEDAARAGRRGAWATAGDTVR